MGRDRKVGKRPLPAALSRASLVRRFAPPGAKYKNFSTLEEPEPFSLSPSLLAGGGGGGSASAPLVSGAAAPAAPFGASLSGFGDLSRSLQEVDRPRAAGGAAAWDFSAFRSEAVPALALAAPPVVAAPAMAPPATTFSRERAGALLRAHESQAATLAERIRAADISNKQRSRALRSITVGANYRSRLATKGAKKQALKKAWGKR